MKRKKFLKVALISFFAVATLIALFIGFAALVVEDKTKYNFLLIYIVSVLTTYIPMMVMLLLSNFSFKLGKKVVELESGEVDVLKEKDYYREILDNYSILELAYLDKMSTLQEEDVLATLLMLEKKKVIKLQDNKVMVDKFEFLSEGENYILGKIYSGKVKIENFNELTNYVTTDALKNGLVTKSKNILKDIIKMFIKTNIIAFIAGISLYASVMICESNENFFTLTLFVLSFLLNLFSGYRIIYLISYIIHKFKSYEVTEKGREIRVKLHGLKRFLKEFSNINEDDRESIVLWDEYLIYSVMFGENKKIINEMMELLNIKIKISKKWIFIIAFFAAFLLLLYM